MIMITMLVQTEFICADSGKLLGIINHLYFKQTNYELAIVYDSPLDEMIIVIILIDLNQF